MIYYFRIEFIKSWCCKIKFFVFPKHFNVEWTKNYYQTFFLFSLLVIKLGRMNKFKFVSPVMGKKKICSSWIFFVIWTFYKSKNDQKRRSKQKWCKQFIIRFVCVLCLYLRPVYIIFCVCFTESNLSNKCRMQFFFY